MTSFPNSPRGLPQGSSGWLAVPKCEARSRIWRIYTGFHPGFDWLDLPAFDMYGDPDHHSGVVDLQTGLYFVGLPFLHTMASYMPRNTVVGLRNTGTEPLKIVAIFSQPGYEEYLREISVPEGQIPAPLSVEELSAIRARHLHAAVYEKP